MAEGGQLPWKCQVVDMSRGPPGDYTAIHHPLPEPPKGMVWHRDEQTREYKLVQARTAAAAVAATDVVVAVEKRKYKLQLGTTWNPHTGREVTTLVSVPKEEEEEEEEQSKEEEQRQKQQQQEHPSIWIENVDYMVHTVLPSDTLAGLCLRYKVRATTLRQVNKFSGTNLNLAPSKLIIPLLSSPDNRKNMEKIHILPQDTSTSEYKLQVVLTEFPHLQAAERRAYLELHDWDLDATIREIKADEAWERQQQRQKQQQQQQQKMETLKRHQLRINNNNNNNNNKESNKKSVHKPFFHSRKRKDEDELVYDDELSSLSSLTTPLLVQSELEMARTRLK